MGGLLTAVVSAALALAGVAVCGEGVVAWRRRSGPATDQFAVVAAVVGGSALVVAASVPVASQITVLVAVMLALVLPIPWLTFAFEYTGRSELRSRQTTAAVAAPLGVGVLLTALIFGSRLFPWLSVPSRESAAGLVAVVVYVLTITEWITVLYAGGLMLVGTGVLLWTFHQYEHLDATSGTLIGVFGSVSWLSLLFGFQVNSVASLALPAVIAVGFLVSAAAVGGALHRRRLFRTLPAAGNIGPSTVFEELDDIVVVTDSHGTVVERNAAARNLPDQRLSGAEGDGIEVLLGTELADIERTDTVELQSSDGRRLFEPTVSELTDQHGRHLGHAVVLKDVTDRAIRRERLEVLNRILRHNLRNDITVIHGSAKLLADSIDDPTLGEHAQSIVGKSRGLTELSETAYEVEQLLASAEREASDVLLDDLVRDVFTTVPEEVSRERDIPTGLVASASRDLLRVAIVELVENAVKHNDTDAPFVPVRARYDPDDSYPVTLRVADNGPGIPDDEREAVLEGDETPLRHGSGLGLWLVRWTVTLLGGVLGIDDNDLGGTTVSVRLPQGRIEGGVTATDERQSRDSNAGGTSRTADPGE